jgi:hypothetical protein
MAYLSAHLAPKLASLDRIVITGDLFDNPSERDTLAFKAFCSGLQLTLLRGFDRCRALSRG